MNALLTQIVDKLESLEEEKEELNQYQKYDKERRAFEYLIHENGHKEAEKKLQQVKEARDSTRSRKQEMIDNSELLSRDLKESKQKVQDVQNRLSRAKVSHQLLQLRAKLYIYE